VLLHVSQRGVRNEFLQEHHSSLASTCASCRSAPSHFRMSGIVSVYVAQIHGLIESLNGCMCERPLLKSRCGSEPPMLAALCLRGVEGPCQQEIVVKIPSIPSGITWAASPANAKDKHEDMWCPPFGFVLFQPNAEVPLPYAAPLPAVPSVPTLRTCVKLYAVLSYTTGLDTKDWKRARAHLHTAFAAIPPETWEGVTRTWRAHRHAAYGAQEGKEAVEQMRFRASCFRTGGSS